MHRSAVNIREQLPRVWRAAENDEFVVAIAKSENFGASRAAASLKMCIAVTDWVHGTGAAGRQPVYYSVVNSSRTKSICFIK